MTNSHLQSSQSNSPRLTFIDETDPDKQSWDAGNPVVLNKGEYGISHIKFELGVDIDELEYDGNDPGMWSVGKRVVWSYDGEVYVGSVHETTTRMNKISVEISVWNNE